MVRQDLHIHTSLSLCAKPTAVAADYIKAAKAMGLSVIAFTNHMWDSAIPGASNWYSKQDFNHILPLKEELSAEEKGLKILFGCECECDKNGTVAISREVAQQMDVLLVPHSHTHMRDFVIPAELADDAQKHGDFLVRHFMDIMESPVADLITAIPHPFHPCGYRPYADVINAISDKALEECCKAAKQNGIALEINTGCYAGMLADEIADYALTRVYTIAREVGCRFTIGSDSHDIPSMFTLPRAEYQMKAAGITDDMLLSF